MGTEERFLYNIPSFMEESVGGVWNNLPIWHPIRVAQMLWIFLSVVLVSVAYLQIFYFRKNMKATGLSERVIKKRKRRNIVSTSYNFAVWLADGLAIVMVRRK
jgi:hypothetical protein